MDARLQLRVQRYGWDAAATHYHQTWVDQLRPAHDRILQMAKIGPGQKVIETACGSGLVTMRLAAEVGPSGSVLATDPSQGMIDDLLARLSDGPLSNVHPQRMSAETLDVGDRTFDAAICALGLMYVPAPSAAVDEMARVTVPGGNVAATVWGERRNCGWAEVFPIVDARVASEVCPMFFGTGTPGALRQLFEEAGLEQIEEYRQFERLDFASAADVLDAVLLGGPVALAVKRFSDRDWQEVNEEFLASVEEYKRSDGSYGIPGEFVTVCAKRP